MKRVLAYLLAATVMLTGCSGKTEEKGLETGDIQINDERLLAEFDETMSIFGRYHDTVILNVEEGDLPKSYDITIASGEISESKMNELQEQYIYYEPLAGGGCIAIEGQEYRSILKYVDKDGNTSTIADDIGFSDVVNISVSPNGSRVAYTALQEGSEDLGLFVYDFKASESRRLTDIKSEDLADDFNFLLSWSPKDDYLAVKGNQIYDAATGTLKAELSASYLRWSPSGSKIAFIPEESFEGWAGKKVCIFDVYSGSTEEISSMEGDEYAYGGIAWSGNEEKLAFIGVRIPDKNSPEWYMKLEYSTLRIINLKDKKSQVIEVGIKADDDELVELANLKLSKRGDILSYTVGNFESCTLYVINTESLESRSFENVKYLHWIDEENYVISAGENSMYFSFENKILRINEKLEDSVKYTSKSKLEDFYISKEESAILVIEEQAGAYVVRYLGR